MTKNFYAIALTALFTATAFLGCRQNVDNGDPVINGTPTGYHANDSTTQDHEHAEMASVEDAICVLMPVGDNKVSGTLHFHHEDGQIHVTGEVKGLSPGLHGFHVHEFGDLTDMTSGKSTGGHFNPDHKMHGKPGAAERHAGDFGNIEANADGVAKIDFQDKLITMSGKMSIIGRGIVIHADEDKFTQPTGDAGGRVAIGVIGVAKSQE